MVHRKNFIIRGFSLLGEFIIGGSTVLALCIGKILRQSPHFIHKGKQDVVGSSTTGRLYALITILSVYEVCEIQSETHGIF